MVWGHTTRLPAARKYGAPLVMLASTHGTTSTASDRRARKQTGGAGESVNPACAPPGALRRRSAVGETGARHSVSLTASRGAVARNRVPKTPPTAPQAACLAVTTKRLEVAPRRVRLLGGVKRLREGRTMAGVPILNKIPYISRLFKNTGVGRETESLMMMVTPRIIIQEEEEELIGIEQ